MSPAEDLIVQKLKEMHSDWGIDIEPPPEGPRTGAVRQPKGSGLIRYVYGDNERGHFLEFYSFHRIWGDLHARIYESGEVEHLAILETTLFPTGDPEADAREIEEQNQRNRQLLEQLNEAGLLSDGPVPVAFQMNAAIATGLVDPQQEPDD